MEAKTHDFQRTKGGLAPAFQHNSPTNDAVALEIAAAALTSFVVHHLSVSAPVKVRVVDCPTFAQWLQLGSSHSRVLRVRQSPLTILHSAYIAGFEILVVIACEIASRSLVPTLQLSSHPT